MTPTQSEIEFGNGRHREEELLLQMTLGKKKNFYQRPLPLNLGVQKKKARLARHVEAKSKALNNIRQAEAVEHQVGVMITRRKIEREVEALQLSVS